MRRREVIALFGSADDGSAYAVAYVGSYASREELPWLRAEGPL